jgi:GNAT superfamily N-acetyltransferase
MSQVIPASAIDIRTVERSEAQAALDILTLAFVADPIFRYFWPRASDYLQSVPRFAMARGERGFDHGTVTMTADGGAAAMWLPPGVEPAEQPPQPQDGTVDAEAAAVRAELRAQIALHHPTAPHWYLWMLGADPSRQGQGLGAALLKHTLRRCDDEGAIAYLESSNPRNVSLYQRHGFEPLAVIRVRDVPPITPMLRPARR